MESIKRIDIMRALNCSRGCVRCMERSGRIVPIGKKGVRGDMLFDKAVIEKELNVKILPKLQRAYHDKARDIAGEL